MYKVTNLHLLTHWAMEELQHAFLECAQKPVEGRILSAIVSVSMVHEILVDPEITYSDIDPEEYCCAV
jgi:hypothetical protein